MKIEFDINEKYQENKIIICTNKITEDVKKLIEKIRDEENIKLYGYKDEKIFILEENKIESIYSEDKKVFARTESNEIFEIKKRIYELENVSPNFRIADTPEIELLKQEILDELFENKYLSEDKDFTKLINTYTSYRDDTPLKDLILSIYGYISSSPYPLKWLNEKIEMFNIKNELDKDFSQTPWGKVLLEEINEELTDDIAILTDSIDGLKYENDLEEFKQTIESDIKQLTILKENLNNWDKSYEIAQNIKFITWPRKKVESEIKDEIKSIRDSVKKKFNKKISKINTER